MGMRRHRRKCQINFFVLISGKRRWENSSGKKTFAKEKRMKEGVKFAISRCQKHHKKAPQHFQPTFYIKKCMKLFCHFPQKWAGPQTHYPIDRWLTSTPISCTLWFEKGPILSKRGALNPYKRGPLPKTMTLTTLEGHFGTGKKKKKDPRFFPPKRKGERTNEGNFKIGPLEMWRQLL